MTDEILWGAKAIGKIIGKGEKATFAMMERGQLLGAQKIAGRWAFNPRVFFAQFESATPQPKPESEFRVKLRELADGTRRVSDIAKLTGKRETVVASTLSNMRSRGEDLRVLTTNAARRERRAEIFERRQTGITFDALGKEYGLSRDRVRQICLKEERERRWEARHK